MFHEIYITIKTSKLKIKIPFAISASSFIYFSIFSWSQEARLFM